MTGVPAGMTVFVGVPTRGLVDTQVVDAIGGFADRLGAVPHYEHGHLSAGMTRNRIVNRFLASECDVLVMVDDDVVPNGAAHGIVARIGEGWDVVAAAYPIFKPELGWPVPVPPAYTVEDGDYSIIPAQEGIVECDAVGTGCVAIARSVFDRVGRAPFAEAMTDDGAGIVSDDFIFSAAARAGGCRIGMDFDARCDHLVRVSLGAILNGISQYVGANA